MIASPKRTRRLRGTGRLSPSDVIARLSALDRDLLAALSAQAPRLWSSA